MLFVPAGANSFGNVQFSMGTTRPGTNYGTTVTPAIGSKGAWAEVISSLTDETYGLLICVNSNTTTNNSRNTVIDIGVGAAASEIVLIPDLIGGNASNYNTGGGGVWYYFPVSIPAGTRVSARAQSTVTTALRVFAQAFQRPLQPSMLKRAAFVEAIGTGTLPNGTDVTSGTTNKGAWTLLGTTTQRCWFWQLGVQVSSADVSQGTNVYHIDLARGDGTNYNIIINNMYFNTSSSENHSQSAVTIGCEYPVPAGSNIYARAQCGGTVDPLRIAAYGAGG
jgi:hypothetical protein